MEFQEYIRPELLVLIPVLYLVGQGLKKSNIPDRLIPMILGIISIALSALRIFTVEDLSGVSGILIAVFTAITQGILTAGGSVYINQLYKQSQKDE